jgi:hypothetical protein
MLGILLGVIKLKKRKRVMINHNPLILFWRPHGDSNPGYRRERPVSWASRRWGRSLTYLKTRPESILTALPVSERAAFISARGFDVKKQIIPQP